MADDLRTGLVEDGRLAFNDRDQRIASITDPKEHIADPRAPLLAMLGELGELTLGKHGRPGCHTRTLFPILRAGELTRRRGALGDGVRLFRPLARRRHSRRAARRTARAGARETGTAHPVPSAGIVDSQTVKGADTVGSATRGFDAGKKLNGRKRHIVTDTIGLLLVVMVTAASIQDRDGGRGILKLLHGSLAAVALVYADGGYQGRLVTIAKRAWGIVLEIVRKPADQQGFAVLPRRWVVERTFSWLLRWRRLVRDYERLPETHEAMVKWAMVGLMLNRLAPPPGPKPWATKRKRS